MSERLIEISDPSQDRYATLKLISWWDQARIRSMRVLVVGAGALGNEVLKNLALLGVGHIAIIDHDRIELSNLTRSLLFRRSDIGSGKAVVAAQRLRELNEDVHVVPLQLDVVRALGIGMLRRVDVVLGCVDNRAARLAINRACFRLGIPYIDGALDVLLGSVRLIMPPHGACYECTMSPQDYEILHLRYSCPALRPEQLVQGRLPTTPTSAAIIGALQVQEAIKLVHGLPVEAGTGIIFSGHKNQADVLRYTARTDCVSHESFAEIVELSTRSDALTVRSLLMYAAELFAGEPVLLLDEELVLDFSCPGCQTQTLIARPYDDVIPAEVPCPACGQNRVPRVLTRLTRRSAAIDVPLRQLGIAPLHVVRLLVDGQSKYLELTADLPEVLPNWPAHVKGVHHVPAS